MRALKKVVTSSLLSGALIAVAAASASAQEQTPYEPPTPDSSGWIVYTDVVARSADVYTVQGEAGEEGTCHFQDEASLAPGESAVTVNEVAFNPDTCQSRLASTPVAGSEEAPAGNEETEAIREASAEAGSEAEAEAARAATRSEGYLWSWYEDPPGIKVAEVANHTTWSWNGSGVLSSPGPVGNQGTRHFSTSGWSLESHNWNNVYNSSQTTSSTYAHFRNNLFCVTIDTHVYADRNTVHGQASGNLRGVWNWSKSGGCNSLLSFNHQLERTLN
ncbi:hypothetical protein DFP74_4238 [Nocardiopsis sp. Huas11]|uniref:hypothetical protein n=1 Tax=Nocardiopsis sp. Huas11 TaxID=2183912 RepID=UPI000EAC309B|nr:hypothetical protein [Nocardiopsis sp. Huas11]RKS08529.1 hypothetical protein DFP74_4238 [Nocardiopsis sp. Huas11]